MPFSIIHKLFNAQEVFKMKAIAKVAPQKGVELVDKPMPEMGINDVLIKIKKTAICGTDVHIYEWNSWAQEERRRAGTREWQTG